MSVVRVVLAVALATALLGAGLPAVEDARQERTDRRVVAAVDALERAALALLRREDPVSTGPKAGRTVTLGLPRGSLADAPVRSLTIGSTGAGNDSAPAAASPEVGTATPASRTVTYRVGDQPRTRVDVGVRLYAAEPLVLGPGRHRLRLSLVGTVDGARIRVRRAPPAR